MSAPYGIMWEVVWRGGLRIRAAPDTNADEVGILPYGSRLMELTRSGDWIRHSQGWSLRSMADSQFLAQVAQAPLPSAPYASPSSSLSIARRPSPARPWSCGACTYQNDGTHTMCALCGTNQSSIWTCSCSYNNLMNVPHCSSCFQANPNVIVKYQVTWQSGLNIRSAPTVEGGMDNVVGSVPHGIILNQLARQGDWIRHERGWTMISAGTHVYMRLHSVTPTTTIIPNQIVAATQPTSTITPSQLAHHFTSLIQHQGTSKTTQQNGNISSITDPTFSEAFQQMIHAAHVTLYESMVKILRVDRVSEKHMVMLEQIRHDTGITEDEHKQILSRIGIDSLDAIDSSKLHPRDGEECVVCLDATPTHFLEPCHHLCLCSNCVAQFNAATCPRCRENVTGVQRIYR